MRIHLILFPALLVLLLVVPALAGTGILPDGTEITNLSRSLPQDSGQITEWYDLSNPFSFNSATGGELIAEFVVDFLPGQSGDYIVHLNSGETITGRVDYQVSYLGFWESFYMQIGESEHIFTGLSHVFEKRTVVIGYLAKDAGTVDQQYYIAMWRSGIFWGFYENPAVLYPVTGRPSDNPIVQVDVIPAGGTIGRYAAYTQTTQEQAQSEQITEGVTTVNWIAWLKTTAGTIWTAIMLMWGIFDFFFIQNLMLTILLVEGAILAYSMNKAPNIFVAFAKAGKTNVYIAQFVFGMIGSLIGYVTSVIQALKPI